MQPSEKINAYTQIVCNQIRWKKAKPPIAQEIENHLWEQRDAYIAQGYTELAATDKAILQMGNAEEIGLRLDGTHRPKSQWALLILTGFLMLLGVFTNYFFCFYTDTLNAFEFFPYVIAFAIFLACYFMDFSLLGKYALLIYFGVLLFSTAGILGNVTVNGRLYWSVGFFSVSASYLALVFPFVYALFVYTLRKKGLWGIFLCEMGYLPFALLLVMLPSLSGLVLYTSAALAILCFSIYKGLFRINKAYGFLAVLIPFFTVFFIFAALIMPYASTRISVFLNPNQDPYGSGYQFFLLRNAFLNATLLKSESAGNLFVIPSGISSNYSLAFLIQKTGLIILWTVIAFVLIFAALGLYKTLKQKSALGMLTALAV
ncbi:MAG: permease prefix domain 1-containing protein, partial [Oscillospiraceae bacterium]|nr:permease prefix domain 1-containing protein [Oscillospiraceae bacterium]